MTSRDDGIPCPLLPDLTIKILRLASEDHAWLWRAGELVGGDDGLYLVFRTEIGFTYRMDATRCAVWCPRLGWRECRNGTPSLHPLSQGYSSPIGLALATAAVGEGQALPDGLAEWFEGLLGRPDAILLAFEVMDT